MRESVDDGVVPESERENSYILIMTRKRLGAKLNRRVKRRRGRLFAAALIELIETSFLRRYVPMESNSSSKTRAGTRELELLNTPELFSHVGCWEFSFFVRAHSLVMKTHESRRERRCSLPKGGNIITPGLLSALLAIGLIIKCGACKGSVRQLIKLPRHTPALHLLITGATLLSTASLDIAEWRN